MNFGEISTNMSVVLKEPRRKGHCKQRVGNPLPVLVESVTGIPAHLAVWRSYSGRFNGDSVEVSNPDDVSTLYDMGFFGKGTLSRGCPQSARKTSHPAIIRERQWKRRCDWLALQTDDTTAGTVKDDPDSSNPNKPNKNHIIVIADTDTEGEDFITQLNPRLEEDSSTALETLNLLLEEAFFLSYALGCLYIFDTQGEEILNLSDFFSLCMKADTHFLQRYVTYHHFRSKGWVVKSGLKFGGDFLLYKDGPTFYHASYIVRINVIYGENAVETDTTKEFKMDWISLMGLNRLAETSGKEVLICHVIWPSKVFPNQILSPNVIKKFKVHEVLMRRWQPSVARIENDTPTKAE